MSLILSQLASFGLNPFEWSIFAVRDGSVNLAHFDDPSFQICLEMDGSRVGRLSLLSL